jgi:hypothetical protein
MYPSQVRVVAVVVGALVVLVPSQVHADNSPGPSSPSSGAASVRSLVLARAGHGRAVLRAVGDRLATVAATNRMSTTKLRTILEHDPTAWIGVDGRLFYVEEADTAPDTTPDGIGAAESVPTGSYPESQTFQLHSLPTSPHKIYLDFDGATVTGTWWNANGAMPSRFYTGFTLDSDPTTFTSAEKAYVEQVWRIVSEKYAPFDVDVTTQDPGAAGYNRAGSSDQTYGDHVLITDDAGAVTAACGGNCSGIALLDTFDDTSRTDSYYEPAWVFSSKTSKSAVLTGHTVAHEVGHTFGLNHDGDSTHAYFSGHGNWFPLMGSGAKGVGQWSKGEYADANNHEDDLAIIAANGAPLRADDHGNDTGTADPLGAAPTYAVDGVISTRADRDVVAIDHPCTEDITATATGIGAGAALDIGLDILGPTGAVVGSANPASGQNTLVWPAVPTGMDATLTVPAAEGTYYVRVDGVGKGDPVSDGYSDYASIGAYHLAIAGCGGTVSTTTTSGTATTTHRAPSAPQIGLARSGRRGGRVTATARWGAPASTGGAAIIGYRVKAQRLDRAGRVIKVRTSRLASCSSRRLTMRLPRGRYRFRVIAYNRIGTSPLSTPSRIVTAR